MKKLQLFLGISCLLVLISPMSAYADNADTNTVSKQITEGFPLDTNHLGTLETLRVNDVYIHLYHGTDMAGVNSYVIETAHKLIVLDAQHFKSQGAEVRKFIDFLEKDVERVIVSHAHADHFMALGNFADLPTFSTGETKIIIENEGDGVRRARLAMGEPFASEYPDSVAIPTNVLEASFSVDGVDYEVSNYTNTEAKDQLVLTIPSIHAVFTSDLIIENVHLMFIDADAYIDTLNTIKSLNDTGYTRIMTGHGSLALVQFYST